MADCYGCISYGIECDVDERKRFEPCSYFKPKKQAQSGQLFDDPTEDLERKTIRFVEEVSAELEESLDGDEVEFIARRFWIELDYR